MRPRVLIVVLAYASIACGQDASRAALARFLATHSKGAGTYGPPDQPWADATWTWQALRCQDLVGTAPDEIGDETRRAVAALPKGDSWSRRAVRTRLLRRVGIDPGPPPRDPPFLPATSWIGSPPLSELEALVEMQHLGGVEPDRSVLDQVLDLWRARDGGWRWAATLEETFTHVKAATDFTEIPAAPRAPSTAGAIAAAVSCHRNAGLGIRNRDRVVERLYALRRVNGGYRQGTPGHDVTGLWATYDALRALHALGARPEAADRTTSWIAGHRHRSGGFAHTPEEPASLEATWLALECLRLLGRPLPPLSAYPLEGGWPQAHDPGGLRLFQAVVQMGPDPGTCVALAHRVGADLLLVKTLQNTEPQLARRARAVAKGFPRPLAVACVREEHKRAWGVEGVGYATHCSDVIFGPDQQIGDRGWHKSFEGLVSAWRDDRARGALVFSASHQHRELLAPAYERSARRGGYDALMAGWAFAPGGDVVRENPWLARWVARMPVIGNHDAHADPFHWLHRGIRTRTLFFANTPDLAGFAEAVRAGRVVAVAHAVGGLSVWGHPYWTERVRREQRKWDRGRPSGALPDPVAYPVDRSTHRELPALEAGFALVVRAASRLGDDAYPHELTVAIDSKPAPRPRIVPAVHDGPPALWLPLPDLESGEHLVEISYDGRTTVARLRWGEPVREGEPPPAVSAPAPPRHLKLESPADVPFVRHTSLAPGDFEGSVTLTCARADIVVGSGAGGHIEVKVSGGRDLEWFRFGVDGEYGVIRRPRKDGGAQAFRLEIPEHATTHTAHRVTIRTSLDGWIQKPARSDFKLLSVEWKP